MKFLFASDSFKGSLSSSQSAAILEREARLCFPDCECISLPAADGGEGTLEAVLQAAGGILVRKEVRDPLGRNVSASYAVLDGGRAFIEMAEASGLPLLKPEERNPLLTGTYGTGQLILDTLERGCRQITVAIGGSATNDGGMGALRALGVRFLDEEGNELEGTGRDLSRVKRIDRENICPLIRGARFTVMCDVKNPLTGKDGAARTFGRQKGGNEEDIEFLETGMERYGEILTELCGYNIAAAEGAGAAGGLGAALAVFLDAEMKPGIEAVLDLIDFDRKLKGVDLVITGEGRMDWQSSFGKVPSGVGEHCKRLGIPAVAVVGGMGEGAENIYEHGILSIIPTVNGAMDVDEAMKRAEELYADAAKRMFRLLKVGISLKDK
ncbi:glycerate kinase [uncultured Clostridium sp.]|uniref:glycerate kinase family protein n=1 Tax=uncultured Clostridium sp. TaxID=59620 RepID=UPI0025D2102A|nr:glycerate kinase [uncultured Clostridium sp.]